jgi:hypothetical protein
MMKYLVASLAALAFMANVGHAAPFQAKNIAADSKWVIHVDVDAVRDSHIVKKMFETCPLLKDSGKHFDMIRDKIGVDLRKDLHGITLYGPDSDKKHAVAIVFSTVNKGLLLEKAKKANDHKVNKIGNTEIHSWVVKHGTKTEPGAGAFYKDDILVFAADARHVARAIAVLDGKSPGITDARSPLGGRGAVKGATVIIRATDIPANAHCPILKQTKAIRIAMGENNGKSFYRARLVMKTPEAAEQIKTITEGFKAMGQLRFGGESDVLKLVGGLNTTVRESTVNVRWEAPVEDVWNVIEKLAKKAGEHIKKMKELHKGQHKTAAEGESKCPFAGKATAAGTCPCAGKAATAGKCPAGCQCASCKAKATTAGKTKKCADGCQCPGCKAKATSAEKSKKCADGCQCPGCKAKAKTETKTDVTAGKGATGCPCQGCGAKSKAEKK